MLREGFISRLGVDGPMKKIAARIAAVLFVFVLVLAGAMPAYATTPETQGDLTLSLSVSATNVKVNQEFLVGISLVNSKSASYYISDLTIKLKFDPAVVSFSGYDKKPDVLLLEGSGDTVTLKLAITDVTQRITDKLDQSIKFAVKDGATATSAQFSITEVTAYLRKDPTLPTLSASNIAHTFTVTNPLPITSIGITPRASDATLSEIVPTVNGVPAAIAPLFSPSVTEYLLVIPYSYEEFIFKSVKTTDNAATMKIQQPRKFNVGDNFIYITVTAEDGVTTKKYTLNVKRLDYNETYTPPDTTTSQTVSESDATTVTSATDVTTAPTEEEDKVSDTELPVVSGSDPGDRSSYKLELSLWTLIGLVAGEIVLFLVTFLAGYMTHKNSARAAEADATNKQMQNLLGLQTLMQLQQSGQMQYMPEQTQMLPPDQMQYTPDQMMEQGADQTQQAGDSGDEYGSRAGYDEYGNRIDYDEYGNRIDVQYDEFGNQL